MHDNDELEIEVSAKATLDKVKEHKKRFEKSYALLMKAFEKKAKEYQSKYNDFVNKAISKEPQPPPKPEDKSKDYDLYIEMLSNHISSLKDEFYKDPLVTLSETLFQRLWLDKWDWTFRHHDTLMFYARAGGSGGSQALINAASGYK